MRGSRPEQAVLTRDTDLDKTDETRAVIEGMVDGLNDHRIDDIGQFFATSFRWMGNRGCGTKTGLREFQDNWQRPFQAAFFGNTDTCSYPGAGPLKMPALLHRTECGISLNHIDAASENCSCSVSHGNTISHAKAQNRPDCAAKGHLKKAEYHGRVCRAPPLNCQAAWGKTGIRFNLMPPCGMSRSD